MRDADNPYGPNHHIHSTWVLVSSVREAIMNPDETDKHPFDPHSMDPIGQKTAYHLMTCDEPYCKAIRLEMFRMISEATCGS